MQGKQHLPIPKLRLHKASGKAAVMLDGKYHYLGPYGSYEAQQRYDRMIAEWLANRRTTTGTEAARLQLDKAERATALAAKCVDDAVAALTVDEVLAAYWTFAEGRYVRDAEPVLRQALSELSGFLHGAARRELLADLVEVYPRHSRAEDVAAFGRVPEACLNRSRAPKP